MATPDAAEIQYQHAHIEDDRSQDIVISHIICIIIAIIAVALRFTSRRLCKVAVLADDYVCFAALVGEPFSLNIALIISTGRAESPVRC